MIMGGNSQAFFRRLGCYHCQVCLDLGAGNAIQSGNRKFKTAPQMARRVDIAAPGGSLDSMPLRAMSPREVNYASMSGDEILGM